MADGNGNGRAKRDLRLDVPSTVLEWIDEQARAIFTSRADYVRRLLVASYVRHLEQKERQENVRGK